MPDKVNGFYREIRQRSIDSLYYFCKAVLGYKDLTPQPHAEMCEYLERIDIPDLLMVCPRGTFKSTIGTVGRNMWLALPRPEDHSHFGILGPHLHILITNAVHTNCEKWLRQIKQHWEGNPMLRGAFPELVPNDKCIWTMKDGLQLNNPYESMVEGEATFEAKGLNTTLVSRHYDLRHHDDPVNSDTVHSPTLRERAKDNIAFAESCVKETSLLNQRFVIGTPYAFDDIVTSLREDLPSDAIYWRGAHLSDGSLFCPSLLDNKKLADKLKKQGPFIYVTQYECDPSAPQQRSFPPGSLQITKLTMNGKIQKPDGTLIDARSLDIVVAVDQATLRNTYSKSRSAVIAYGMDSSNDMYAIDGQIGNLDPLETIEEIVKLWKNYPVRVIDIEAEAYTSTLQFWLEKHCEQHNLWEVAALTQATSNPRGLGKDNDIHLTLLPFASKKKFYCAAHLTEFALEWSRFPSQGQPYDGLDTARRARRFLISDSEFTPHSQDYESEAEMEDREEEALYATDEEEGYRPHFAY
jgi:hypothetical protein